MASPLSEKVQLCPHCNKFLSSRTVLRHRKLYGKSKRRAWRPALHVPSIGAHSLPLADQTDEEFVDMSAASREIPEDTVMMDEASGLEDDPETELDTSGCSDDDEDGQAAQHWDEAEEELERDITSRDQRKQHNKTKWFKKTNADLGYLHPITVWQKRVQNDGPASYIPIQRILGKCAWTIKKHGVQNFIVVSPLPRHVFS
ncbi:uncharacterized protein LOC128156366 isoform X1 [Crassostrea angulata]|uniref:uncharacterized protein LOC128156366 isoform X1 n=2 Tax=Magallana angulata TaxID=2784310 RepID=UPI0022B08E57|nr:uncharacterized protein LOC128156366 isoform X1 [Crassostrea angulata]